MGRHVGGVAADRFFKVSTDALDERDIAELAEHAHLLDVTSVGASQPHMIVGIALFSVHSLLEPGDGLFIVFLCIGNPSQIKGRACIGRLLLVGRLKKLTRFDQLAGLKELDPGLEVVLSESGRGGEEDIAGI